MSSIASSAIYFNLYRRVCLSGKYFLILAGNGGNKTRFINTADDSNLRGQVVTYNYQIATIYKYI